jgi:predicted MFS family arabinose efflux permease
VLLDRVDFRFAASMTFLLPAITCVLLLGRWGGVAAGPVIGLLIGAALGAPVNMVSYSASHYFEQRHFGFVSGIFFAVLGIAIGVGSWMAGLLFDLAGSYVLTQFAVIGAALIAAGLVFSIRPRAARVAFAA